MKEHNDKIKNRLMFINIFNYIRKMIFYLLIKNGSFIK